MRFKKCLRPLIYSAMAAAMLEHALHVSVQKLGISCLKPKQELAIRSFVAGRDVFVSLPTGYGKSACYGCLPSVYNCMRGVEPGTSIILVISPLKALMKDQVTKFNSKGISAVHVGAQENENEAARLASGDYQSFFQPKASSHQFAYERDVEASFVSEEPGSTHC